MSRWRQDSTWVSIVAAAIEIASSIQGGEEGEVVALAGTWSHLCAFLGKMPLDW
jgi:hypothetical protein